MQVHGDYIGAIFSFGTATFGAILHRQRFFFAPEGNFTERSIVLVLSVKGVAWPHNQPVPKQVRKCSAFGLFFVVFLSCFLDSVNYFRCVVGS